MKKIIDNKRVEMTNDEYIYYKNICSSYDRPNFEGKELFKDHFEVNDHGIITFVKPPQSRYTSMEVYTFLISLMNNQHMRINHEIVSSLVKEASEKIDFLLKENSELKEKLKGLESKSK